MLNELFPKSFFCHQFSSTALKSLIYSNYQKPRNHLNVLQFLEKFKSLQGDLINEKISLTGRLMRLRSSGSNLHFFDLIQDSQRVQLILNQEYFEGSVQEALNGIQKGDIIEIAGFPGRSKRGELSCKVEKVRVLTPCLLNLPDDKIGIKNPDLRATKRHLDLIANPASYQIFKARSKIISNLRRFLEARDFMEVETPIIWGASGGAIARPFKTKSSAQSGVDYSLRIAPELFLKRLVIGGFDRVFELGKQFRDEGIDATHNPEFTSCEFYSAYTDLDETASLLEDLLIHLNEDCCLGDQNVFERGAFKRVDLIEEIKRKTGCSVDPAGPESFLQPSLLKFIPEQTTPLTPGKVFDKLVGELIEPRCVEPTFLFGHPIFVSPLSKECPGRPGVADRFELIVRGRELANAYVELNDPVEQSTRFQAQQASPEIPEADEDFVEALRAGLPPTTGCGIGIDRLVMLLTGQQQIRNVLLFPL